jgi:hypothetical protein
MQNMPWEEVTAWKFRAYDDQGRQVWLEAVKFWHMPLSRITHSAAMRDWVTRSEPTR